MAINITAPAAGAPFGVGWQVQLSTDVIGPLPVNNQWQVWIMDPGNPEVKLWGDGFTTTDRFPTWRWRWDDRTQKRTIDPILGKGQNATVRLLVERWEGSTLVETLSQDVQIDYTAHLQRQVEDTASQQTGGLTPAQNTILLNINAWLIWELVGDLLPEIAELIGSRIRTKPVRRLYDPDRAGSGELLAPATGFFIKWVGIEWELLEIPPGVGFDEGNPVTEEIDYMQLSRLRAVDASVDLVEETFYERRRSAIWYWGMQEPSRINYYILPGALVRFYALLQLEPVASDPAASANPH